MIISTLRVDPLDPLFLFWDIDLGSHQQGFQGLMSRGASGSASDRFFRETGLAAELAELVEPTLVGLGFRLVRVEVSGREGKTVQVMAERPDGTMSIEDCETVSRQLSPMLDVNDIVAGSYRLEVSSPGIDRPLVRPDDFETWAGHEAKIELKEPVDGRKRFRGRLEGLEDGEIRIEVDLDGAGPTLLGLPIGLVATAKLMLTDALIRAALSRAKKQSRADETPADGVEIGKLED